MRTLLSLAFVCTLASCAAPSEQPKTAAQANEPPAPVTQEPVAQEPAAAPAPAGPVDYSCKVASDCAIKNVGSCCGYYPRCVNVKSEPTPVKCSEGVMGVCGFPAITHCACEANQCVSMQAKKAI